MNKLIRESNFELLRIFAMILILLNHLSYHGGFFENSSGFNKYVAMLFVCGGKFGVTVFVILGSYFMINKKFRIKRVLSLWMKTLIISLISGIAIFLFEGDVKSIIKSFFPMYTAIVWYVPVYIALMVLSPWLSRFCNNISKISMKLLLAILSVPLLCIPTLKMGKDIFLGNSNLLWFIFLYLITYYLKNYLDNVITSKQAKMCIFIFVICYCFMWGGIILFGNDGMSLRNNGSIFVFVAAISIFIFFWKAIGKFNSRMVNLFGKSTFFVYLLHDNQCRQYIWHNLFRTDYWYDNKLMILYSLAVVMCIFGVAILFECITSHIFNYLFKRLEKLNKFFEIIDMNINAILDEIGG